MSEQLCSQAVELTAEAVAGELGLDAVGNRPPADKGGEVEAHRGIVMGQRKLGYVGDGIN